MGNTKTQTQSFAGVGVGLYFGTGTKTGILSKTKTMKYNKQNVKDLRHKFQKEHKSALPVTRMQNALTFKQLFTAMKWELFDRGRFIYFISMYSDAGKSTPAAFNTAKFIGKQGIKEHLLLHNYISFREYEKSKKSFWVDVLLMRGDLSDVMCGLAIYLTVMVLTCVVAFLINLNQ